MNDKVSDIVVAVNGRHTVASTADPHLAVAMVRALLTLKERR